MLKIDLLSGKNLLGALSVGLTFIAYVPYYYSLFRRRTKPHLFSWIVWTIMNTTAFFAQYTRGAGAGSWAIGFTTIISFTIIGFAAVQGEKNITRGDWLSFIGAFFAIFLWYLTDDPLGAVILVSIIDIVGCFPTLRKSYDKPWEEPALTYALCGLRAVLALAATETYTPVTVLHPISLVFSNALLVSMLLWRRAAIAKANLKAEHATH